MLLVVALLVALPIVELAVLIQVGQWIGVVDTIGLLVLVSLIGVWLVKRAGTGALRRIRADLAVGKVPSDALVDGGLLAGAGVLLIVPGFVTDCFGLLLLVPPVRSGVRWALRSRFSRRAAVARRPPYRGPGGGYPEIDV